MSIAVWITIFDALFVVLFLPYIHKMREDEKDK